MRILRVMLVALLVSSAAAFAASGPKKFQTLDDAAQALITALRANDQKALAEIFGPHAGSIVSSGDAVADRNAYQRFAAAYAKAHRFEGGGGKVVLAVGDDDYPFPIPLVPDGPDWRWDADAGREEILNRRIGRNELDAIQVCLAYVDAQREYYSEDRDGDGVREYAQRIASSPGKHDGLYWPAKRGELPSPLGPLVVQAQSEGYAAAGSGRSQSRTPFHGYLYRMLMRQGPDAPGGAYEYVVGGHMIGGFALLAYPANYGVSGVMTFMVSHDGDVYQKDLGRATLSAQGAIQSFNPDSSWNRVVDAVTPTQ